MKIKIILFLIICLSINSYSQRNPLRKIVGVHQLDPRFTFSIEKFWSGMADEESYYIYVTNNTADEYILEIEFDLTLNCYDVKPRKLGFDGKVRLKPFGEQMYEGHYMITSDREKRKACLIEEGDTYTLYRTHTWQILSKINVTQQKASGQKPKMDRNNNGLTKTEADKKAAEQKLKQEQEKVRLAKIELDKREAAEKKKKAAVNQGTTISMNNNSQHVSDSGEEHAVKAGLINASTGEVVMRDTSNDITKMSKPVIVNETTIKVFQQNGKYFIQKANGSVSETTKAVYDAIQNASIK